MKRSLTLLFIAVLAGPLPARAQGKLNVMTTTEDLASIAREIGGDRITVDAIATGFHEPPRRRREAVARSDGALQRDETGDLPPIVSEFRRALRPEHHRVRRAPARHSAHAAAHARPHQRDEAAEREARSGRAVLRHEN